MTRKRRILFILVIVALFGLVILDLVSRSKATKQKSYKYVCGLTNHTGICFINSSIQCFLSMPCILELLDSDRELQNDFMKDLRKIRLKTKDRNSFNPLFIYTKMFKDEKDIKLFHSGGDPTYVCSKLYEELKEYKTEANQEFFMKNSEILNYNCYRKYGEFKIRDLKLVLFIYDDLKTSSKYNQDKKSGGSTKCLSPNIKNIFQYNSVFLEFLKNHTLCDSDISLDILKDEHCNGSQIKKRILEVNQLHKKIVDIYFSDVDDKNPDFNPNGQFSKMVQKVNKNKNKDESTNSKTTKVSETQREKINMLLKHADKNQRYMVYEFEDLHNDDFFTELFINHLNGCTKPPFIYIKDGKLTSESLETDFFSNSREVYETGGTKLKNMEKLKILDISADDLPQVLSLSFALSADYTDTTEKNLNGIFEFPNSLTLKDVKYTLNSTIIGEIYDVKEERTSDGIVTYRKGHAYCFCSRIDENNNKIWYKISDSSIDPVELEDVLEITPLCLFYTREN